ncbi:toll/interleukin-1 receptor domain-containing protein, partial [Nostoc sp. UIC 10607]|uniref:toll/interleukin-1 receptor domain-containing protein n=1 Tax=Nostoc sp. UIC 10607 TaxID=3045935 RepID=UPI00399FF4FD
MLEVSLKLFFSYSHKDETLRDELAKHLTILERQGVISSWHDRKILPGEEWDHQINDHLNTADIILLLISSDFIASNYCWEVEVITAIKRHNTGKACVIPIILRDVDWSDTPFAKLQFLPNNAQPVTSWTNRDTAFKNVAQGIKAAASQIKSERQQELAVVRKEAAIAKYRQKVEEFADDGEISLVESKILKHLQEQLGLTDEEARTVRDKVLEPYDKYLSGAENSPESQVENTVTRENSICCS